ncbi:MAG: tetratricopeptide repeat protein [Bacteroidia bacterium]|nr:tetratricopeptide repeat protein [Bacteroidia bacterium]
MWKHWLITTLFFSVLLGAIAQVNPQYYLQQGITDYRAGRYEEALRSFDRAIQADPSSSEAYLYRGNTQFILRRYTAAETDYTSALETNYRARPESTGGTYRAEGITIMEPNPASRDKDVYALLYNNRGAARYLQGRRDDAMRDFDLALDFSPTLELARENRQITTGNPYQPQPVGQKDTPLRGVALGRPIDPITFDDPNELREAASDVRDVRTDGRVSGIAGLFQPRPFEKRSIPRKGKIYKEPRVAAASQNYIRIVEVQITDRETLVKVAAENREGKSYYTRVFPPGSKEAYVLVDRNPDGRGGERYELLQVEGISTESAGTLLKPGEEIMFTLKFRKIDDRLGYVNLVEGNLQVGSAWNFYQIDLTR